MSAIRGFVVLGGIAAVPLGLVYSQAACVVFSSFSSYAPQADFMQTSARDTSLQCIQQADGSLRFPASKHTRQS
ncbi:hypothetical protein CERZMDRAFT_90580 [Cercospora zeae-maydis SCOH1-5]|uniref:Uncharacterized protein n=1 Tax=Cercospora zeae-maydis SCOH1-5 TaxID=717836 RepID=A0A6A6FIA6_9PEZI|nr:hypothetical protein CERZMDRAFT_90580 [Cercospora zeae-maydis SCOH1-5]